ncbi:hypothetical protein Hanom_Chr01g00029171 [Helianthus anomalus]
MVKPDLDLWTGTDPISRVVNRFCILCLIGSRVGSGNGRIGSGFPFCSPLRIVSDEDLDSPFGVYLEKMKLPPKIKSRMLLYLYVSHCWLLMTSVIVKSYQCNLIREIRFDGLCRVFFIVNVIF